MKGLRRALIPLALLLAIAVAAPRAWYFVSTIPEGEFSDTTLVWPRTSIPALPFDVADFRAEARVLRWGERRGERHGPFSLVDADGRVRMRGAYQRGKKIGRWSGFDADGERILRGVYLADDRHGLWIVPLGPRIAEVEYDSGELLRWRMSAGGRRTPWAAAPKDLRSGASPGAAAPSGFDGELALHAIGRGSALPGTFVAIGLGRFHKDAGSVDPDWVEEGTWICFDAEGRLEGFGPMDRGLPSGLWTFFAPSGEISRQVLYRPRAEVAEERTAPPWRDVAESFPAEATAEEGAAPADPALRPVGTR